MIVECFEVDKDSTRENVISHEKTILSQLECLNICEKTMECYFSWVNLRNTSMRGCWLLKRDPHFEDAINQTYLIGPSHCSKIILIIFFAICIESKII